MQIPICQKQPNFRIPFSPLQMPPLHSAARGGCPLRPLPAAIGKFVFGNRVVDYWNGLSDSCVNCSTINDFKSKIKVELEPEL